jgi:hypothetical protein
MGSRHLVFANWKPVGDLSKEITPISTNFMEMTAKKTPSLVDRRFLQRDELKFEMT